MSVNPAIMREPKQFAAVIARLERWEVVPSPEAYYPEFDGAKGFKLPRERWELRSREIKEDFLAQFGRGMAKLLADPEYAAALRLVQDVESGKIEMTEKTSAQVEASLELMEAAEARVFPGAGVVNPPAPGLAGSTVPPTTDPAPSPKDPDELLVRVGNGVPEPKKLQHVEPTFPAGGRGAVIAELTIDREGRVVDVHILRGDPFLVEPFEQAVRQWTYEPVRVNGQPVPVLLTVSLSAR